MEWKEVKLGNLCKIQTGPFGSQLHQADYVPEGIPCIMPTNIGQKLDFIIDNIAHVTEGDADRLSRHLVKEGDIVYARRGDIEKCAYVTKNEKGWLCGTGCLKLTSFNEIVDSHFIAYQLSTQECKKWIVGNAVGTTMLNLNTGILGELPISLPSLKIQSRIASILSSLDSKIETNNKINAKLEEMAQALFKSWFVDFEPFKDKGMVESELGMIPVGWRVGKLGDIADITSGKRPPMKQKEHSKDVNIPLVGAADVMGYTNNVLYETPILVIGRVGTHGIVQRWKDKCWPSDNTLVIVSKYYEFVYHILSAIDYKSLNRGSTQPLITQTDIKNTILIIPTDEIMSMYEEKAGSLMGRWYLNKAENSRLSLLRDTLLPKLMSGEIEL